MTIGDLWLPVLGAGIPPLASFSAVGTFDTATLSDPQTVTFPGSYTTQTNDLIIVAYSIFGPTPPSFSGSGATWVNNGNGGHTAPVSGIAIGYASTSGNTGFTMTGQNAGGVRSGTCCFAVVSGGQFGASNPIQNAVNGYANGGNSATTSPLSWTYTTKRILVVGAAASSLTGYFHNTDTLTWGGSLTAPANLAIDNNQKGSSRLDWAISQATSSGTLFYKAVGQSGSQFTVIGVALTMAV